MGFGSWVGIGSVFGLFLDFGSSYVFRFIVYGVGDIVGSF